jgi:hypothetical protein
LSRGNAGESLEISVPASWLPDGAELAFRVLVSRADRIIEQHPQHQPIRLVRPGPDFDARHWRA